ncbi:hypothetical protein KBB96_12205 [Luteolibacter ambystomatis]|uniref:Uncharacterized protein n=1 Tax=Luteolibacter ambystomatis TaxID=2824561 RepID=A0A975IZF3_9BACT|nr:hypothetical protein [Luteolibacter ambystomatis]QUE49635.1 hypothetical protein KBB96_12205 [Luteolibacter ambystomatis]
MALAESWHLRSRSRECAATGQPFTDGQPIVTALFPDPESSGYLRKDFNVDAWKERSDEEEKPFSFWKAVYHAPVAEEKPAMHKENPEDLLRRLVEEDEDHTENVRYILAVMLERQKLLRETDTQRLPTGILRVYEHRKAGDVFIIKDPNIPLSQVDKVQEEIILLLENGGRLPVAEIEQTATEETTIAEASEPPVEQAEEKPLVSDSEEETLATQEEE